MQRSIQWRIFLNNFTDWLIWVVIGVTSQKIALTGIRTPDLETWSLQWKWNCRSTLWRKRGKVPFDAYYLTQCSNGSSLDSLLFPRQDNHVQKCAMLLYKDCRKAFFLFTVRPYKARRSKNESMGGALLHEAEIRRSSLKQCYCVVSCGRFIIIVRNKYKWSLTICQISPWTSLIPRP